MKKLVVFLSILIAAASILITWKYQTGREAYWPLTYEFESSAYPTQKIDTPILIVGDRMGVRLSNFSKMLADEVSKELSTPIKVASIAKDDEGLHRTIEKLKALEKLPLIIIYFGASQEYLEQKFYAEDIEIIKRNMKTFKDIRIQSLLMLAPWISRLIYLNTKIVQLGPIVKPSNQKQSDTQIMTQNEINFNLFKYEYEKFIDYIRDRNAYLIAITSPINYEIAPKKACDLTIDSVGEKQMQSVLKLVQEQDYKGAYRLSKDLPKLAPSNAQAYYIHGKVSKQLGHHKEAIQNLKMAASFDCTNWRASPVHNAIIKQLSKSNNILLYDFNKMLYDNWTKNVIFQDELYPQNYFMEQMITTLAGRIRSLLKL